MIKRRVVRLLALMLVTALTVTALGSCVVVGGKDYMTEEDVAKYLASKLGGNITVEGGDNYDVDISVDGALNIVAAAKALLSSVSVYCTFSTESVSGWGPGASVTTKDVSAAGSGVIYKLDKAQGDAFIITNYHVVYNKQSVSDNGIAKKIDLYLYGQESAGYAIPATYVGGSMEYDLAVLRVSGSRILAESAAVAAELADSDSLSVLDTAIAIGNPEGEGISATVGHVNVDSEYIDMTGADGSTAVRLRVIRTDAAVNSGNSGGGLFNDKGQLIGIVNAKMATSSVDNIGYAIPSNVAKYISENIIHYCFETDKTSVYKCLMGITVSAAEAYVDYDTESGRVYKREVVKVETVENGAAASGLLAVGDIIRSITIDGVTYEVDRIFKVVDSMLNARVGSTVIVTITRGDQEMNITVPITSTVVVK